MDTILNLGLTDETVKGLFKISNERFAYDAYRRFIQMYGMWCLSSSIMISKLCSRTKEKYKVTQDTELTAQALKELVKEYKDYVKKETKKAFQMIQLRSSKERATPYSNHGIISADYLPQSEQNFHDLGTAVNVQTMVFGNMGETSGTGVAFTRDPGTGERKFLANTDECSGRRRGRGIRTRIRLVIWKNRCLRLFTACGNLQTTRSHFRDMQD